MRRLAVIGVAVLAACTMTTNDGDVDIDPITDEIGDWSGELTPRANSGIRGNAAARSAVATSGVSVTIAGARSGARHPWHIHRGTCGSGGPIVGGASAYPPIVVGSDGVGSASADLAVGLSEDGRYYVNIHRSPSDLGTIVACGSLRH